jgi:hypothetical protein
MVQVVPIEMTASSATCLKCGAVIQQATAARNCGLCQPCSQERIVPPRKTQDPELSFDYLVAELLRLGAAVKDRSYSCSGYLANDFGDGSTRSPRAREIGQRLHELGGMTKMRRAHKVVYDLMGGPPARELEICWDGVGEWRS